MVTDRYELIVEEMVRRMAEEVGEGLDAGDIKVEAPMCPFLSEADKRDMAVRVVTYARIERMTRVN